MEDVWWATYFTVWCVLVDIEIYCADEYSCSVGPPIGGVYGFYPELWMAWQHVNFEGLELYACGEQGAGRYIVMITDRCWCDMMHPYSDRNPKNIEAGCEAEWRCAGHSYVYRNVRPYCDIYGLPGPLWIGGTDYGCTNFPSIPPGCHDYYGDTGYSSEWLIECYIDCRGPTQTQKESWSDVKALYR